MVANEIKELAKETAKATEDISRRIEAIQTDTKAAVEAIAISEVSNQINGISNTIATAVEEQSATTNEMARQCRRSGAWQRGDHEQHCGRSPSGGKHFTRGQCYAEGGSGTGADVR